VIIDFSDNDIETLAPFKCLATNAPNLKHLSLSNNNLSSVSDFDYLNGYKALLLELLLTGNPLTSTLDKYVLHHQLLERFPGLKLIDSTPPLTSIKFNLPSLVTAAGSPYPIKGSFFDSQGNQNTCAKFINGYFQLFDADDPTHRQKLYGIYTPESCFSLCISKGIGTTSQIHEQFSKSNRNLHDSSKLLSELSTNASFSGTSLGSSSSASGVSASSSSSLLKVGPLHITSILDQLPKTRHNVKDFIADVFLVPTSSSRPLLNISIRGKFLDITSNLIYSFQRVFLLTPASQPGPWPALILNDQLTIVEVVQNNNPGSPHSPAPNV